jgi:hypothetical protein
MSILNLNTAQGRGPAGKKSLKIWMGVGLLAAVLGFGSTFAANITLNSPGGTTEFGQGVTQSVYCGGNKSVTVSPFTTYQNTVKSSDTPAVETVTANISVLNYSNSRDDITVPNASSIRVTIAARSSSSVPRWGISVADSSITGFWVTSATSYSNSAISAPTNLQIVAGTVSGQQIYFAPETSSGSGKYKNVNSNSTYVRQIVVQQGTALIAGAVTSPASFKVGGVMISDIPSACANVDFVVSSFAETGTAQTLISGGGVTVKEIAAQWSGSGSVAVSRDRNSFLSTTLVTGEQTGSSLKFILNTASGTALAASDLYKLIVETQQDSLS